LEKSSSPRVAANHQFKAESGEAQSFNLGDFWQWALSDLRSNTTRGLLAEFLVGKALEIDQPVRTNWANHDFEMRVAGGIEARIEVKSSGYVQSWEQAKPSSPSFAGMQRRGFPHGTDGIGVAALLKANPATKADIYVMALQTAQTPEEYNPMDLTQWVFFVATAAQVREGGRKSYTPDHIRQLGWAETDWAGLRAVVCETMKRMAPQHAAE
jgi:hypothetical protein